MVAGLDGHVPVPKKSAQCHDAERADDEGDRCGDEENHCGRVRRGDFFQPDGFRSLYQTGEILMKLLHELMYDLVLFDDSLLGLVQLVHKVRWFPKNLLDEAEF